MNMELITRIAFWIFTLSVCLQARSIQRDTSEWMINLMRDDVKCLPDTKFYAPENVMRECIYTALDCVMEELRGRAKVECEDPKNRTLRAARKYEKMRDRMNIGPNNSTDCVCEKWPQTSFSEFLDKITSLLELATTNSK